MLDLAKEEWCRGGITADAIGWLKLWARISVRESGRVYVFKEHTCKSSKDQTRAKNKKNSPRTRAKNQTQAARHKIYPASGPLRKVTPLLQL